MQWAYLEGVGGYVFPGGADLMSLREERVGTWHAIDVGVGTEGDDVEIRRIFHTLWLDHGVSPQRAGYMYVLLPGASEEETARRAARALTIWTSHRARFGGCLPAGRRRTWR